MAATVDDYGRAPEYAGTKPGNPRIAERIRATPGRVLVPRPWPEPALYFDTDQPES